MAASRGFHRRRALARLLFSSAAGAVAAVSAPSRLGSSERIALGWNIGSTLLLALSWIVIAGGGGEATRRRAAASDPGRTVAWVITFIASIVSLISAVVLLRPCTERPHPAPTC